MDTDGGEAGSSGEDSGGEGGAGSGGGGNKAHRVDFDRLPEELRKHSKKADPHFREQIEEKTAELERLAPNLKVHASKSTAAKPGEPLQRLLREAS